MSCLIITKLDKYMPFVCVFFSFFVFFSIFLVNLFSIVYLYIKW